MKSRRPRAAALGAFVVAAAIVVTGALIRSGPDAAPLAAAADPTVVPPTTTSASTTTSTLPPLAVDPMTTTVATAWIPVVAVLRDFPAGTQRDQGRVGAAMETSSKFAAYSPERGGAPAIPTVRAQVQGRRATATGWEFDNPTPFGNPLVFDVVENQGAWLRVKLPARPNGSEGWISASDVVLSQVTTHVVIDVGQRKLSAYRGSQLLVETGVVVGKDRTQTPRGHFFVTDYEKKRRGTAYGPWVLPTSAYSQALDEFDGGVPVVAMHGTNRPDLIGSAASNGCIRMPDDVIQLLRDNLPLGTPVDIRD